jgi:ElaB/YqjD/DUF883 family membrane-anchored ribosome-binding protein
VRWIQSEQPIVLYESKEMKLVSNVGESERDFRIRLAERAREARDAQADRVRERFESRFRTLQDRLRRAEQAAARRAAQSQQAVLSTGVAVLGGLLGAMLGGGAKGQLGRASTAARGAGRVAQTRQEAAMAGETVEAVRAQIDELERELQAELRRLDDAAVGEAPLDEVAVRANLNAISMRLVALAWLPYGPTGRSGGEAGVGAAAKPPFGLPGCWSQGSTEAEALANIQDAIRDYLVARDELTQGMEVREVEVPA